MQQPDENLTREAIFEAIKNDETMISYITGHYSNKDPTSFLSSYAGHKSLFMKYADMVADQAEKRDESCIVEAQLCLLEIQKKKLYDIMCLWNANQFTHELVQCSWDFFCVEADLLNCPFLPPITAEEFKLYLRFANSNDFEYNERFELLHYSRTTNFDNDEENGDDTPFWFDFENLHTGNSRYLLQPNLRLPQESKYRDIAREEAAKERLAQTAAASTEAPIETAAAKPYASGSEYNVIKDFILACESKDVLEKFNKYYEHNPHQLVRDNDEDSDNGYLDERAIDIIMEWQGIKDIIPIKENADWRQALIEAYDAYKKEQIINALPFVYEDYCMRLQNGFGFDWQTGKLKFMQSLADNVKKEILRGRVLSGEPADFNF